VTSIERALAERYAGEAAHGPLDPLAADNPYALLETLERIGLLEASGSAVWRDRIERLARDPAAQPRLPDEIRRAARDHMAARQDEQLGFARRALEAVGALGWRDSAEAPVPRGIVVERVYPVPAQAPGGVTVSTIVRYEDAIEVCWYAPDVQTGEVTSRRPVERSSPLGLGITDDRGARYLTAGPSHSSGSGATAMGSSLFWPAPARDASWVEVTRNGTPLVRVPLT
jgi:hypothetical protein